MATHAHTIATCFAVVPRLTSIPKLSQFDIVINVSKTALRYKPNHCKIILQLNYCYIEHSTNRVRILASWQKHAEVIDELTSSKGGEWSWDEEDASTLVGLLLCYVLLLCFFTLNSVWQFSRGTPNTPSNFASSAVAFCCRIFVISMVCNVCSIYILSTSKSSIRPCQRDELQYMQYMCETFFCFCICVAYLQLLSYGSVIQQCWKSKMAIGKEWQYKFLKFKQKSENSNKYSFYKHVSLQSVT